MVEIRQLSPSIVNKIAAGEVIERPASVVKELLENAIDARATRIDVALEQGGSQLVRLADNGIGIAAGQLPLAVASHATSKIQTAEDLFSVHTLGFRGEALASIAEISHMCIRSRVSAEDAGAELEIHGGRLHEVTPCGCAAGTTIEVRNLFFNTPVRRKFLRSTQTEMGHATEAFHRIALAYPQVHFSLTHNGRLLHELPPVGDWRQRIAALMGADLAQSLIFVESQDGDVRLAGYVADPQFSRANNRMQYLFLNGRHIRDRSLQHALSEAYRGLLLTGRYPIAFLRLELPAELVDVNVHPTKLEVRFQDAGRLYSQLLGTLRRKFLSSDLTAVVHSEASSRPAAEAHDTRRAADHRAELQQWARGQVPHGGPEPAAARHDPQPPDPQQNPRQDAFEFSAERHHVPPFRPFETEGPSIYRPAAPAPRAPSSAGSAPTGSTATEPIDSRLSPDAGQAGQAAAAGPYATPPAPTPAAVMPSQPTQRPSPAADDHLASRLGVQLQNRYLVTEDELGIVVIDQHALHERVLYEQLREKVLAGEMETQQLLVPETVCLTPAETAAALEAQDVFARLGIAIEPFGGDTLLISSYPAMLSNINPTEVVRQVIDQLLGGGQPPEPRDLLDDMLHMISCKAAVKAGDRLAPAEVQALLEQRHLFQDTHHCPHGRPTALRFTNEELDKRFRRI